MRSPKLLVMWVAMAIAGSAGSAPSFGANGVEYDLQIEQQSLGTALQEFSKQSGVQIVFFSKVTDGYEAPPLKGKYTASDALQRLLNDSALTFREINAKTIEVQPKAALEDSKKTMRTSVAPVSRLEAGEGLRLSQAGAAQNSQASTSSAAPVPPQEEAGEKGIKLDEIIVTARKREERLQDVPVSVSAYSAADIEAKSLNTLKDLGQFTPNLSFSNSPARSRGGAAVFMRGVGQQEADIMWEPGVGVYIDGVYIARMQGLDMALTDLERVEVLRGPQGTLFGKNTIGGAVNLVSARPTADFYGEAQLTAGSYDKRDARLSLNVPLIPGKLAARFVGATNNQDGYGKRINFSTGAETGETGNVHSRIARASFYWTPSERFNALLSFDGSRSREQSAVQRLAATNITAFVTLLNAVVEPDFGNIFITGDEYTNYANGPNATNIDNWGSVLTATWDFGAWQLKSITGYRDLELLGAVDLDGSPYTVAEQASNWKQHQLSQEFQFSGAAVGDRLNWLLGAYYFEEAARENIATTLMLPLAPARDLSATRITSADIKNYAVFGQSTYNLTEKLSATTGLRYSQDKKELGRVRFSHVTGNVTAPFDTRENDWSAVSGTAGLEYRWNPDLMTYVSVARGFKSGGFNADSTSSLTFRLFDPEYIWSYELGLKSETFERRLRFNAAVFFSDYTDQQFLVRNIDPVSGVGLNYIDNAGKSKIKGFELDMEARPIEAVTLSLGAGYVDAEYVELKPGSPVTTRSEFVETPKWTYTASGQYKMPLATVGTLTARVDYVYKSHIQHDLANNTVGLQKAFGLLNSRLTFDRADSDWSLALYGTNLTDERYLLGALSLLPSLGFASQQYARPREWGVSFLYSF